MKVLLQYLHWNGRAALAFDGILSLYLLYCGLLQYDALLLGEPLDFIS